ncbi:MAG: zf-HC2 domain-containing protein [Candidatus Manganitrophus sp. SB1]|nr:zf-HC2 domain-containing protein [Candidatus Manganitrophus morganii]
MKCREIEEDLSAYLAEEADPALCRSIKAHLKGCKKCRSRIAALKAEKGGPKKAKEVAISSEKMVSPPQERSSGFPSTSGMLSALWHRPVEITVTIVLIGGTLFLYQRGASDLKADFSMTENGAAPAAETVALSAPAENHGGTQEKETPTSPPPSSQTAPADPPAPMPMKVHNETAQPLSMEARRQAALPQPSEVKLLLISRSIKEAADAVASQGKVLSKKGDEMEAKVVLLIPAERYERFSRSLQSLGLLKEISKKPPPAEGSLKVEVTIE